MKKLIAIVCILVMTSTAFASGSRTNDIVTDDAYERLQVIKELQKELKGKETILTAIEKELHDELVKIENRNSAGDYISGGIAGTAVSVIILFIQQKEAFGKGLPSDIIGWISSL